MGVSVGLSVALLCCITVAGVTAQDDARKVTKDGDKLAFMEFQTYCTYGLTETLNQPPESAGFGDLGAGIIGVIAPGTVNSLLEAVDVEKINNDPEYLNQNWQGFTFAFVAIPILFILGLVLAFCVPCCGLFFCCCRCCGSCGGKMMQKDEDNTLCRRAIFALILLVTAIILGVGCASVYLGGKTSISTVDRSLDVVGGANDDLRCYTNSIAKEIAFLIELAPDALRVGLEDDISTTAKELVDEVEDVFARVKALDESARALSESLKLISDLQSSETALSDSLTTWLDDYEATLNSAECRGLPECDTVRNNFDRTDFDIPDTSVDISTQQNSLQDVLNQNLTGMTEALLRDIEKLLDIFDAGDGSMDILGDFNTSALTGDITASVGELNELFDVVSDVLNSTDFQMYYSDVSNSGFIGVAIFAGFIGIISILYVLGIIFGEIGRKRDDHPLDRHCMANCGGCLLVVGWVFSFLFYFIIAILAAFYFLGGSIGEIFICQPLADTSSFDQLKNLAIDVARLTNSSSDSAGATQLDQLEKFNISKALSSCEMNGALYESLNLQAIIGEEIDQFVSTLTENLNLEEVVGDINITDALNFDGKQQLDDLAALDFSGVDFAGLGTELNMPVPNLNAELDEIRALADAVGGALEGTIDGHADALQSIIDTELAAFNMDLDELKAAQPTLESNTAMLKMDANELSMAIQTLSDTKAAQLEEQVNSILPTLQSYVNQTVNHIVDQVKTELGRCRPLYNLYRGVEYILCDNLINALNAIWVGLGIAVVFFILGIIFAVKLSKFYRRMLYDDDSHGGYHHDGYNGAPAGQGGHGGYPSYDKTNYPV